MKSVIAVSMHKAGSSLTDRILVDFFETREFEIDRVASRVPSSPLQEPEFFAQYRPEMKPEGVYYGMARNPGTHELDFLREFRIIAQMRDPRDCLVSGFFSFRESHVPPKDPSKVEEFEKRRARLLKKDIDTYVIDTARNYLNRCTRIRKIVTDYPEVLLLHYEEMVEDTDRWLGRIAGFVDQPLTDQLRKKLARKTDFTVSKEDTSRHKRQITPGDHRRKLKPETIAELNEILGSELEFFGYGA